MPKVYKLEPIDRVFSITWNIGTRCNYDCMYCPTTLHDNHSKHTSLELLKRRWQLIYEKTSHTNLPYKISFTGGEVSANKNFLPLVRWIRNYHESKIFKILATSNGSASLSYYRRLITLVDNLSLSLHSEHVDEQKFFDTVLLLHQNLPVGKHLHVNIMDEFWNQQRIPYYQALLKQQGISHSVNKIDYSLQTRTVPIMKGKLNLALQQSSVL